MIDTPLVHAVQRPIQNVLVAQRGAGCGCNRVNLALSRGLCWAWIMLMTVTVCTITSCLVETPATPLYEGNGEEEEATGAGP